MLLQKRFGRQYVPQLSRKRTEEIGDSTSRMIQPYTNELVLPAFVVHIKGGSFGFTRHRLFTSLVSRMLCHSSKRNQVDVLIDVERTCCQVGLVIVPKYSQYHPTARILRLMANYWQRINILWRERGRVCREQGHPIYIPVYLWTISEWNLGGMQSYHQTYCSIDAMFFHEGVILR